MTKAKTKTKTAAKVAAPVDETVICSATLTVAQILKQMVLLNVIPTGGTTPLHASRLSFDRSLLPGDYDFGEGREYELVIKRVK